jgi:A/G-specific adenine glycosylase
MTRPRRGEPARRGKPPAPGNAEEWPDLDPLWRGAVQARLLAWYDRGHRDLPWREERDPYRVLVAETMLVQTTVAAVSPFYERFLTRFPTVVDLANADPGEVMKAWEGLGYYRRARLLHEAARQVVERHGGRVPDDPEALRDLPGIGPYIAGAVLSFAFDRPAPIVEANTQRVLTRLLAWAGDLRASATGRRLWEAAARLVPLIGPGRFNQALMDLGALVCLDPAPRCLVCPLSTVCRARGRGIQDDLPVRSARPAPSSVTETCVLVDHEARWLVLRRGSGRLWEGFWEFPTLHLAGPDPAGRGRGGEALDKTAELERITGLSLETGPVLRTVRYTVTRYRVALEVRRGRLVSGLLEPGPGHDLAAWEPLERIAAALLAAPYRKVLEQVLLPLAASPQTEA